MRLDLASCPNLEFWVDGLPQQKGSKKGIVVKRANVPFDTHWRKKYCANVVDDNKKDAAQWEQKIKLVALEFRPYKLWTCAVRLDVDFIMPRPKTVTRQDHTVKPDRDKLLRCVQDALTGMIYKDDSQVIEGETTKIYGSPMGARIVVWALGDISYQRKLI